MDQQGALAADGTFEARIEVGRRAVDARLVCSAPGLAVAEARVTLSPGLESDVLLVARARPVAHGVVLGPDGSGLAGLPLLCAPCARGIGAQATRLDPRVSAADWYAAGALAWAVTESEGAFSIVTDSADDVCYSSLDPAWVLEPAEAITGRGGVGDEEGSLRLRARRALGIGVELSVEGGSEAWKEANGAFLAYRGSQLVSRHELQFLRGRAHAYGPWPDAGGSDVAGLLVVDAPGCMPYVEHLRFDAHAPVRNLRVRLRRDVDPPNLRPVVLGGARGSVPDVTRVGAVSRVLRVDAHALEVPLAFEPRPDGSIGVRLAVGEHELAVRPDAPFAELIPTTFRVVVPVTGEPRIVAAAPSSGALRLVDSTLRAGQTWTASCALADPGGVLPGSAFRSIALRGDGFLIPFVPVGDWDLLLSGAGAAATRRVRVRVIAGTEARIDVSTAR